MGISTFQQEVATLISPAKLFKAFALDGHFLLPRIIPQFLESVELIEGDGGVGTLKQFNLSDASPYKYVKERIVEIDEDNLVFAYNIVEGDPYVKFEKVSKVVKFEGCDVNGGCICKAKTTFYPIGDNEATEEDIVGGRERFAATIKAIESYLLANP